MSQDAITLIDSQKAQPDEKASIIETLALDGVAYAHLHRFPDAERVLGLAEHLCAAAVVDMCGNVIRANGVLAVERGQTTIARQFFQQSLSFARAHNDHFLEATALLNLGLTSLREEHFDEAIDWTDAAYQASTTLGAGNTAQTALGNLGWAYYNLGDLEKSLELSLEAERRASQVENVTLQLSWITNIGYVYAGLGNITRAKQSYLKALDLATMINGKEDIYNALRALALVSVESGELEEARKYSDQAIAIAQTDNNRADELYPLLVKGLIAARLHDGAEAKRIFREVERDPNANASLKWRSEHALARLYEDEVGLDAADREYRAALATFEAARSSLQRNNSKLPFSNNASHIYDDYVHFLVARGKTDEALRWADYSRARTLAEGLGLLGKAVSSGPPPLNPREIARRAGGTVLFYWLGEKQSYLWAITARTMSLFTLPPGSEIDAAVLRYRKGLGLQDVLASADPDGRWLYRTLVAPAQEALGARRAAPKGAADFAGYVLSPKRYPDTKPDAKVRNTSFSPTSRTAPVSDSFPEASAKVFVIPDGSLNNLNFETLLVSEPVLQEPKVPETKLHYWIEDATIANASSLRVLGAAHTRAMERLSSRPSAGRGRPALPQPRLLLIGDSLAPNSKYPELPKAAAQIESVARHFPAGGERILAREQATPTAYMESNPELFSYIHFVAHGTASRLSPLDSAIVLSKTMLPKTSPSTGETENDSFKLYARDIIRRPLHADLVTISACYGAGERAYSGEGLVGLSWAFLLAGAHNVIAALWEATDASTLQLMDEFYSELDKGASPDVALRTAKLSLLRSRGFHNPFYWAPFQLYTGS